MSKQLSRLFSFVMILALILMAVPIQSAQAATSELFISEYIEGSSFNKAVEIYNGTGSSVDLSTYSVELYSNGASSPSQSVALSGTLADGDVFVMAHGSADPAILAEADLVSSSVINFNGDDALVLRNNGAVVDSFGQVGVDPGSQWPGGGQDDTLRRTEAICAGDTDPTDAFDASVEWVIFAQNTFDGLGTHTADCGGGGSSATDVFMSEYIEGSSFNKAIEIYNGTDSAVDLSAGSYTLELYSNGSATVSQSMALSGTIAAGDVYVLAHPSADPAILAEADVTSGSVINFNGDDAVVLRKDGAVVDSFGQVGFDPGSQWAGGGQDDTLRRAEAVCAGDTDPTDAFDASVEWVVFANNTFDGLGSHTANCGGTTTNEPVINEFSASTTGSDIEYVEIFGAPDTDYSAYTVLELEGDSSSNTGTVDEVISLGTTDADGFYLASLPANALENGSISLLLVKNFTGALNDDLDTNDDGAFDATPWDAVVDAVSVNDGGSGDLTYGVPALGPNYDGVSNFSPGGASRIPDGFDTDAASDWVRNDFDLAGISGYSGSIGLGEAYNTPGAANEIYVAPPEMCGDPFTPIYNVQGNGAASPLVNTEVAIEGVVVGDFQNNASVDNGDLNGFHVQDPVGDGDAATSDGVFVYAPGGMDVAVGDVVRVRGSVSEYFGLTEITASQIWNCGTGGSVTPAELSLPVSSVDDFEPYEGMLVTFPQPLVISEYFNFDRFGEIVLTSTRHTTPTAEFEPGPAAIAAADAFLLDRITLDDGRGNQNPDPAIHPNGSEFTLDNLFRGGDTVANVTGVMDYSFSLYRIQPTQGADYTNTNVRTTSPDPVGGNFKIASFNVLNYFSTLDDGVNDICGPAQNQECRGADDAGEFTRQRDKIIAALTAIDADVVGLLEIENNINDDAVIDLVGGLNDAYGSIVYDYVATGAIGTDAIKVALIYKPASVSLVGNYAILDSSVDPRFIDDKNRPTLAQTFVNNSTGGVFTVAVNHLKSKGSACNDVGDPDTGDGAGNCNLTRKAAAEALVDWLASDPTGSGDDDFLIIGDLNSYDKEDPIDVLLAGGYTDMIFAYQGEVAYSYVFDGQTGYLDYALASADLVGEATGVTEWHINADEPDLIDYDTSFKQAAQDAIYAPDAYRSSDHDPVIIGLELTTAAEIHELIDDVQKLVDDGVLNGGQGNALFVKLEHALEKLAAGKSGVAANQLGAFINQVEDFVNEGILTAEQGDVFINAATFLVEALD